MSLESDVFSVDAAWLESLGPSPNTSLSNIYFSLFLTYYTWVNLWFQDNSYNLDQRTSSPWNLWSGMKVHFKKLLVKETMKKVRIHERRKGNRKIFNVQKFPPPTKTEVQETRKNKQKILQNLIWSWFLTSPDLKGKKIMKTYFESQRKLVDWEKTFKKERKDKYRTEKGINYDKMKKIK